VHSLDIAAASGLEVTLPPQVLGDALHLAIDGALICGDGQTLLGAFDRSPAATEQLLHRLTVTRRAANGVEHNLAGDAAV